ncbi:MAG: L-glutamate gamma-semialdehyde dehydrogenase [Gammaproteobacteria bacterium]|nr:L-glutamate gamma-semialdehyde dehydrogenase [Gammaproteobacteria bacterium]MCY4278298.1 L-glutamate gamma-semialdehyde dehydrogenase [Gammaproteobacteria bacterium]
MTPPPHTLDAHKFAREAPLVQQLAREVSLSGAARAAIETQATDLVRRVRASPKGPTTLDAFLSEFGLKSDEGVALMCLAEALLRVPDARTVNELIADKLGPGDWNEHLGQSDSLLVNASTFALMLTGRIVAMDRFRGASPAGALRTLTARLGAPAIRRAVRRAMSILGGEFVMGRTLEEAMKRAFKTDPDIQYSFDILGEGARTMRVADDYFEAYQRAIPLVGANQPAAGERRSGMSIKLTALHPRYEARQSKRVHDEMYPRLKTLFELAREHGIALCIDAEESGRLVASLELVERLCREDSLKGWDGIALAVQAYGRRAKPVIHWLANLARETGRQIPVRLVKGAYWDAEIKHAQMEGLEDYPVFTRKAHTDLSYLSCAEAMLAARPNLYCAFATHNAHTLTAILHMAENRSHMELQRIHGMGERLHEAAREIWNDFPPVRVYAPVGEHKDLLAYLVRRLLENGANSSFVNRLYDDDLDPGDIVADPLGAADAAPALPSPRELYGADRPNSIGMDLESPEVLESFAELQRAQPKRETPAPPEDTDIESVMAWARAEQPAWDALGGKARAEVFRRFADLCEAHAEDFHRVLADEAGKTIDDAVAEVREAVDFARYYALQAARDFANPLTLPDGPTGESNTLALHGRGVFLCISPWNFPLAIFTGQVAAALLAGNSVVAKPAEQTPRIAEMIVRLLREAGVPRDVLHLVTGGAEIGAKLVAHPCVAGIAFTGGTATASKIHAALVGDSSRPIIPLIAETGGQNAMIVDSSALIEQATDDIVRSAFLSAGQRCSALRVLCVQEEIADELLESVKGAAEVLSVGDPRDPATDIGPIIDDPARQRILAHIHHMRGLGCEVWSGGRLASDASDTCLLPHLIEIDSLEKLGGECFGPVLHVMRFSAKRISELIDAINGLGYGLTLGIQSRVEARIEAIALRAQVGNIYVNRDTVGAVVGVQPFGGMGLSGTGPKAGGPRYLARFAVEKTITVNTTAKGGNVELLRSIA